MASRGPSPRLPCSSSLLVQLVWHRIPPPGGEVRHHIAKARRGIGVNASRLNAAAPPIGNAATGAESAALNRGGFSPVTGNEAFALYIQDGEKGIS